MAKQGLKRPDYTDKHGDKKVPYVPEINGSAKSTKKKANNIIAGTSGSNMKVYHGAAHGRKSEKPIADVYKEIDTDLARDNLENDITAADLQDM